MKVKIFQYLEILAVWTTTKIVTCHYYCPLFNLENDEEMHNVVHYSQFKGKKKINTFEKIHERLGLAKLSI